MSKRAMIVPVVTLSVAAALLSPSRAADVVEGGHAEQRTDDAYVRADLTPLSTRISGTFAKWKSATTSSQPGQLLVQLEDQDYAADSPKPKQPWPGAQAQMEDNHAAKGIQDVTVQTRKPE